jgi:hypothetical protein
MFHWSATTSGASSPSNAAGNGLPHHFTKKKIMALKLIVRNKLRVPIRGTIADETGAPVKFDFVLLCKRLNQVEIDKEMDDKNSLITDFLHRVVEGWESVLTEDGEHLPFNENNLAAVLLQAGMHTVCFHAYLKEVGATAKN